MRPDDPIETPRLLLRPWADGDEDLWHTLARDVGYHAFSPPGVFLVRDDAEARERVLERAARGRQGLGKWPIFERATGAFVGTCGIDAYVLDADGPDAGAATVELGYRLLLAHWGRGFAREAAAAALGRALALGRARVHAFALPQNRPSLAVLRDVGFREVGRCRHGGLENTLFVAP